MGGSGPNTVAAKDEVSDYVFSVSRITSMILLIYYILHLYFWSMTHAELFAEKEAEPQDKLHAASSVVVLIVATLGVAFCSECLVDSVDGFVEALGVSPSFIGLIIVLIVGARDASLPPCSGPEPTGST